MGPPRTNQEAVSSEPRCPVMAGPGAAQHLERECTSQRPPGLSRVPGRRRETDGSAPSRPHCIWGMNGSVLRPPGFQAKAGSANPALRWRGDVQAVVVVGRGAQQPPRPWLLLFSWESKPQNAGKFIHLPQGDPRRKNAIQMSLPAFLGNTHPEPMHVRAHTHALAHPH